MYEQNNKIKTKAVILIILSVSFVPVSYMWYGALTSFDCKETTAANHLVADQVNNGCARQASSHWILFYGVNAMIYCIPMAALVLRLRK